MTSALPMSPAPMTTHLLATPDVDLAYDVYGPLPTTDGRPPLFMIAQPMTAEGFDALRGHFPDRTVVTYDPRGLGRSTRKDGRVDHTPTDQAADLHALIDELGGPVDVFASSGGAGTAPAPGGGPPRDVAPPLAHQPPLKPGPPQSPAAPPPPAALP